MNRHFIAVIACATWAGLPVGAQDLGRHGSVYEIQERDAVDMLQSKLAEKERSGELRKLWEDYRKNYLGQLENPAPIPGIVPTDKASIRTMNPSFTFPENVYDHLGNLVVREGAVINPLQYTPLSKDLLFIDGRDPAQVEYAKKRLEARPRDKIILVAGSFLQLNRETQRPTYFDQRGILTTRLGIKKVPALVSQRGNLLQIHEFLPSNPPALNVKGAQ